MASLIVAVFAFVQLETALQDMIHSPERWDYEAAVDFMRREKVPTQIIAGGGFAFAFESGIMDDPRLGYYSGNRLGYIAANPIYQGWIRRPALLYPDIHAYQVKLLAEEYRVIFHNTLYTVYERVGPNKN